MERRASSDGRGPSQSSDGARRPGAAPKKALRPKLVVTRSSSTLTHPQDSPSAEPGAGQAVDACSPASVPEGGLSPGPSQAHQASANSREPPSADAGGSSSLGSKAAARPGRQGGSSPSEPALQKPSKALTLRPSGRPTPAKSSFQSPPLHAVKAPTSHHVPPDSLSAPSFSLPAPQLPVAAPGSSWRPSQAQTRQGSGAAAGSAAADRSSVTEGVGYGRAKSASNHGALTGWDDLVDVEAPRPSGNSWEGFAEHDDWGVPLEPAQGRAGPAYRASPGTGQRGSAVPAQAAFEQRLGRESQAGGGREGLSGVSREALFPSHSGGGRPLGGEGADEEQRGVERGEAPGGVEGWGVEGSSSAWDDGWDSATSPMPGSPITGSQAERTPVEGLGRASFDRKERPELLLTPNCVSSGSLKPRVTSPADSNPMAVFLPPGAGEQNASSRKALKASLSGSRGQRTAGGGLLSPGPSKLLGSNRWRRTMFLCIGLLFAMAIASNLLFQFATARKPGGSFWAWSKLPDPSSGILSSSTSSSTSTSRVSLLASARSSLSSAMGGGARGIKGGGTRGRWRKAQETAVEVPVATSSVLSEGGTNSSAAGAHSKEESEGLPSTIGTPPAREDLTGASRAEPSVLKEPLRTGTEALREATEEAGAVAWNGATEQTTAQRTAETHASGAVDGDRAMEQATEQRTVDTHASGAVEEATGQAGEHRAAGEKLAGSDGGQVDAGAGETSSFEKLLTPVKPSDNLGSGTGDTVRSSTEDLSTRNPIGDDITKGSSGGSDKESVTVSAGANSEWGARRADDGSVGDGGRASAGSISSEANAGGQSSDAGETAGGYTTEEEASAAHDATAEAVQGASGDNSTTGSNQDLTTSGSGSTQDLTTSGSGSTHDVTTLGSGSTTSLGAQEKPYEAGSAAAERGTSAEAAAQAAEGGGAETSAATGDARSGEAGKRDQGGDAARAEGASLGESHSVEARSSEPATGAVGGLKHDSEALKQGAPVGALHGDAGRSSGAETGAVSALEQDSGVLKQVTEGGHAAGVPGAQGEGQAAESEGAAGGKVASEWAEKQERSVAGEGQEVGTGSGGFAGGGGSGGGTEGVSSSGGVDIIDSQGRVASLEEAQAEATGAARGSSQGEAAVGVSREERGETQEAAVGEAEGPPVLVKESMDKDLVKESVDGVLVKESVVREAPAETQKGVLIQEAGAGTRGEDGSTIGESALDSGVTAGQEAGVTVGKGVGATVDQSAAAVPSSSGAGAASEGTRGAASGTEDVGAAGQVVSSADTQEESPDKRGAGIVAGERDSGAAEMIWGAAAEDSPVPPRSHEVGGTGGLQEGRGAVPGLREADSSSGSELQGSGGVKDDTAQAREGVPGADRDGDGDAAANSQASGAVVQNNGSQALSIQDAHGGGASVEDSALRTQNMGRSSEQQQQQQKLGPPVTEKPQGASEDAGLGRQDTGSSQRLWLELEQGMGQGQGQGEGQSMDMSSGEAQVVGAQTEQRRPGADSGEKEAQDADAAMGASAKGGSDASTGSGVLGTSFGGTSRLPAAVPGMMRVGEGLEVGGGKPGIPTQEISGQERGEQGTEGGAAEARGAGGALEAGEMSEGGAAAAAEKWAERQDAIAAAAAAAAGASGAVGANLGGSSGTSGGSGVGGGLGVVKGGTSSAAGSGTGTIAAASDAETSGADSRATSRSSADTGKALGALATGSESEGQSGTGTGTGTGMGTSSSGQRAEGVAGAGAQAGAAGAAATAGAGGSGSLEEMPEEARRQMQEAMGMVQGYRGEARGGSEGRGAARLETNVAVSEPQRGGSVLDQAAERVGGKVEGGAYSEKDVGGASRQETAAGETRSEEVSNQAAQGAQNVDAQSAGGTNGIHSLPQEEEGALRESRAAAAGVSVERSGLYQQGGRSQQGGGRATEVLRGGTPGVGDGREGEAGAERRRRTGLGTDELGAQQSVGGGRGGGGGGGSESARGQGNTNLITDEVHDNVSGGFSHDVGGTVAQDSGKAGRRTDASMGLPQDTDATVTSESKSQAVV